MVETLADAVATVDPTTTWTWTWIRSMLMEIPDLDLVVVVTSDADKGRHDGPNLVGSTIVPAITS